MKCQKCSKPAMIHLTEIITDSAGHKRAVEIHLCLGHAQEAGLVAQGPRLGPAGMYVARIFGPFEFGNITLTPPTSTFEGEYTLHVGGREAFEFGAPMRVALRGADTPPPLQVTRTHARIE